MRVVYDGYIFAAQQGGGISRYFASLISRLPNDYHPVLRVASRSIAVSPSHSNLRIQRLPFAHFRPSRIGFPIARGSARVSDYFLRDCIAHPTYHFTLPDDFIRKKRFPLVVTIHDMIPELLPEGVDDSGVEALGKRHAIEAADAIFCVSENTKRDLQRLYKIPDQRIVVTHLASELDQSICGGPEEVPASPYLLFIGNRGIYKNFARVVLAFRRVAEIWKDLRLCVVGAQFSSTELEWLTALGMRDRIVRLPFVPDAHLAKLYRCSEALVYPSLYEGFGIPPLEAMACGTVVITSNRASIPEVVGTSALMVNPESVDDLSAAIESLRTIGNKRQAILDAGFAQSRKFSWEETARRTAAVYRSLSR